MKLIPFDPSISPWARKALKRQGFRFYTTERQRIAMLTAYRAVYSPAPLPRGEAVEFVG